MLKVGKRHYGSLALLWMKKELQTCLGRGKGKEDAFFMEKTSILHMWGAKYGDPWGASSHLFFLGWS